MAKLGKKARKFAKKKLQTVERNHRKTKTVFKKKSNDSKGRKDAGEDRKTKTAPPKQWEHQGQVIESFSLDDIFVEEESDVADDASDSDGYLSEGLSWPHISLSENENNAEVSSNFGGLSVHNIEVKKELTLHKKKLDKLKKKDPEFAKFLASYEQGSETFQDEEMDSDEDTNKGIMQLQDEDISDTNKRKVLNKPLIDSWFQLAKEDFNESAITSLLNGYRAACHYGDDTASQQWIINGDIFSSILMFMLREADQIFRSILKIPLSSSKKEVVLEIKNTPKWKIMKPLIKSYLRSTLLLLNQMTDSEILAYALGRLRASLVFFAAFPSLLHRLVKATFHLWASGEGVLSASSFLIIRDVAVVFSTEYFELCVTRTYKAYITHSKVADFGYSEHIQFLRNSFVELCSLDVQKSYAKVVLSIERLTYIFKLGLQTKKKEVLEKICGGQYANCFDLWVTYVAANMKEYDLHQLYYVIVQLINGVACLFPGPRYYPLRLKCIQWLNCLSSSSGIFVPVASLVLDILEYGIRKELGKKGKINSSSSVLKLPNQWLKSRNSQEECLSSAIELFCGHFSQWSYHISFPEVATFPLIRLKKFHDIVTVESFKRMVKRLIDQVEQNVEFVQKRRDEVAFSPKDHTLVESFLQFEKSSANTPFTQYYKSVIQNATSRDLSTKGTQSSLEPKEKKRKRGTSETAPECTL